MITLRENHLEDVLAVFAGVPEFDPPPEIEHIQERIRGVPHLILTAYEGDQVVGFKIGYERDGRFYSWLGGVIPTYRKSGVAGRLADHQEQWAKQQGYSSVWMKTRNRFPQMLVMAIRRGFRITSIDLRDKIGEHRIVLEKSL